MTPVGLLPVDKPEGPTSHDTVALARRILGVRRIGHTGTLDPFASGLLLLCVGWATRLAEYVSALPKTYIAVIRLGETTDTDDRTGTVVARDDGCRDIESAALEEALATQTGVIDQRPPDYSAKKVGGERAYALARRGESVELEKRSVRIGRLELRDMALPDVTVEVDCSRGTYIRALARDVGEELGCGAHLLELRRTRIGDFELGSALALTKDVGRAELLSALRPVEEAVAHLPARHVDRAAAMALGNGQPIQDPGDGEEEGPLAVFEEGRLRAVASRRDGQLRPEKVFRAG